MAQPRRKLPGFTYVKCAHCGKPFRIPLAHLKRRHGVFCTRQCYRDAIRSFIAHYSERPNNQLDRAA